MTTDAAIVAPFQQPPLPEPAPQPGIPTAGLALNRQVKAFIDLKMPTPRSPGFHPSEIVRLCPVLEHFSEGAGDDIASGDPARIAVGMDFRRAVLRGNKFPANLELEFRVGDGIHEMVQFQLGRIGVLVGVWECAACGARTPEPVNMPRTWGNDLFGRPLYDAAPCRACSGQNMREDQPWRYVEPDIGATALAKAFGIAGHTDGILHLPRPGQAPAVWRYVLEIKSINEGGFTERIGPLPKPEHVAQASIYGWALGISHICFIYVCKNQVNQWKEFVVPVDMRAVEAARDKIIAVRDARASGRPPLHARVCADIREERARNCPAVERCFGAKPPANFWSS